MPYLKQLERSATLAFCQERNGPGPILMAAGTVAGAVDMTFSTNSVLEVVSLDFSTSMDAPPIVGSVQAPERFNRLAWGPKLAGDGTSPAMNLGLLAGGLADGSVCLWDPTAIIGKGTDTKQALVAKMQKHTGAVKGLEFNTFSPNLLASGAADSDLCIWDLAKPSQPSLYPALKGASGPGMGAGNEINFIAWNRKVQHILASCTANGTTVVWDLKRQKPVISFRDPNSQRRASVLQWNPEVATQLVVASDDDRSPTLQMWDLRNSVSPLKEFVGHSKGVLGMAWSPHDTSLLLSSAKDNRTICWDVQTADIMCELPASSNWNFDVQWCPSQPGVFSTASFDGRVGVYNIHACTMGKVTESVNADFTVTHQSTGESVPLRKAPAWMRRPCGATFGFGGKLVSFFNHKLQMTDGSGQIVHREQPTVSISQVVTEHELVQRSEQFEQAIAGGEKPTLQNYCSSKASTTEPASPEESETWSFLSLLFENDGRRELLKKLGFGDMLAAQEAAAQAAAQANGVAEAATKMDSMNLNDGKLSAANSVQPPKPSHGGAPEDFFNEAPDDDPDFFDKLPDDGIGVASPAAEPDAAHPEPAAAHEGAEGVHHVDAAHPDASTEHEEEIQRAMIAGNYELAVETCFKANRLADALLIANIFNSDLFKRTMHRYMKRCPKPYMSIVRANVDGEFETLVRTRPVGQWRETLALLATYTSQEDWAQLCDVLAQRLHAAGMHHAASLCHICAGNVDGVVAYWARTVGGAAKVEALQGVIEKAVIMGLATGSKKASVALSELVTSYASILAAQGRMSTALDYLEYVPGEASTTVAVLKDRIYRSGAASVPQGAHPPPFPFIREEVRPAARMDPPKAPAAASNTAAAYGYNNAGAYGATAQTAGYGASAAAPAAAATNQYGAAQQYGATAQQYGATQQQYGQQQQQYGATQQAANPYAAQSTQAAYGASAYGAQAGATQQHGYGAGAQAAAGGYGASAAQGYGAQQQAQQQQQQQQQQQYGATAQSSYTATSYATSQYAPTTTNAGAGYGAQQQQAARPAAQQQAASQAYGASAYTAPQQQAQPAYSEPAAPIYQAKRSAAAAPPPPAPAHNAYTQQAAAPAPAAPAAPVSTASGFVPTAPAAAASHQQPVGQAAAQPSYFMPTTTPAASVPAATPTAYQPVTTTGPPAAGGNMPGMMGAGGAPAPMSQKPAAPAPPPGPPANISVATADTNNVPAAQRPAIASLTNLFNSCAPLANNPAKKREMDDNSKKLGQLFWKLNAGDVSEGVVPKLLQLCQAIDAADWHTANHIQVQMTTTDWEECGFWLAAVKRLIKMRQQGM